MCFLSVEFPMPKTELVQKFHVFYLGVTYVSRPIGKAVITLNSPLIKKENVFLVDV